MSTVTICRVSGLLLVVVVERATLTHKAAKSSQTHSLEPQIVRQSIGKTDNFQSLRQKSESCYVTFSFTTHFIYDKTLEFILTNADCQRAVRHSERTRYGPLLTRDVKSESILLEVTRRDFML
jgi:hypothetical protein